MGTNKIHITGGYSRGSVIINGLDLSANVCEIQYVQTAGHLPQLTIVMLSDGIAIDADDVELHKIEAQEK